MARHARTLGFRLQTDYSTTELHVCSRTVGCRSTLLLWNPSFWISVRGCRSSCSNWTRVSGRGPCICACCHFRLCWLRWQPLHLLSYIREQCRHQAAKLSSRGQARDQQLIGSTCMQIGHIQHIKRILQLRPSDAER